ncbi:MAG: nuclear transport factor 2 family protein [Ascidiaceihabitans sp.]|uniref:nuclear transport factor 2 family protein n=1 Tax=Rhodobacterales TaxID=204455 RepID=UPI003297E04F
MNHALKTLFSATGISLMAAAPVVADTRTIAVENIHNGIIAGDRSLIETHVAENIIPHNPSAGPGRDGVLAYVDFLTTLDAPVPSNVVRVLAEGDLVVIQRKVDFVGPKVSFDLLRFEDGQLVEYWDAMQLWVDDTASGRSMTDGPTDITDLAETEANKALVTNFVTDVLMQGKLETLETYLAPEYMQHTPFVPDTLDGLKGFISYIGEQNIEFYYSEIHNVVAEGDFVFVQSEASMMVIQLHFMICGVLITV